mgnify:CR=1 FL=1
MESRELAIRLARALDAKKAFNIHILEVEDLTTVTEYFVIATGNSTTHVGALADEAEFQLGREGVQVLRTEGHDGKRWVLLDYGSVIVHVFTQEAHGPMPNPCPPASGCRKKPRPRPNNLTAKPI